MLQQSAFTDMLNVNPHKLLRVNDPTTVKTVLYCCKYSYISIHMLILIALRVPCYQHPCCTW